MPPSSRSSSNLPSLPPQFKVTSSTQIAVLWSNYGHIYRLKLSNSEPKSLILKSIHPPAVDHPSESHLRKLLSYNVERWFYQHLATRLSQRVKLAESYSLPEDAEHNLLLEDLSIHYPFPASGSLGKAATLCVLHWLAGFHGTYFGISQKSSKKFLPLVPPPKVWHEGAVSSGVWQRGTYFYLDTRREEFEETDKDEHAWLMPWVEQVNDAISRETTQYGTLVHGDVKGANIVFNRDPYPHRRGKKHSDAIADASEPLQCALYDLQYVGLGLGTLDLVYFLGTSVESALLSPSSEKELLEAYHAALLQTIANAPESTVTHTHTYDFDTLWKHWELAIVDWYRFMAGWGFWGNDTWVEKRAREIVSRWQVSNIELWTPAGRSEGGLAGEAQAISSTSG